jgi:Tol biopolymer transport system component
VIAPDGQRFAITIAGRDAGSAIWTVDRRGARSRFTRAFGGRVLSQWSPDGRSIVYSTGSGGLFRKAADGGADEESLFSVAPNASVSVTDLSPDGLHALTIVQTPDIVSDIWIVPIDLSEDAEPEVFLESPFVESDARFSPDGRFIAYTSNESGRNEIYVRPYPRASGQWKVSTDGGEEPRWRGDGRELFYVTPDERLEVVSVSMTPTFEPGVPQTVFELQLGPARNSRYDVTRDGQRFLVSVQEDDSIAPITITVNWLALLER